MSAVVTAIGAITPVGASAAQTAASVRAGLARFELYEDHYPILPDVLEDEPEPLRCARALAADAPRELEPRLVRLASAALHDLLDAAALDRAALARTALYLCLPEERAGAPPVDGARLSAALLRRLSLRTDAPQSRRDGAPGALAALAEAAARVSSGEVARALVVAADSCLPDDVLSWLDERWRLRTRRNPDGFLPGEAGAALLVESAAAAAARGARPLAALAAFGHGREPFAVGAEANPSGTGLCAAIRAAARAAPGPLPWAVCDLNGESHRAHDWAVARVRLGATLPDPELWHPADCTGEVGAAAGALLPALVARALAHGAAPSARALVCCSADGGSRAACIMTAAS